MFDAYYDRERFRFLHNELLKSGLVSTYKNQTLIPKTAVFKGKDINFFIDTSDGVNEDINIQEYCGRIKRVIKDSSGKPFIFFKSAYSNKWSKNIKDIAEANNGKVFPFFKWSFNKNFYDILYNNRNEIIKKYDVVEKEYDIGVFFQEKPYNYPRPSESDPLIAWSDHKKFNLTGDSKNMGEYINNSRLDIINRLKKTNFRVLHAGLPYKEYIKASLNCKVVINPPGIGEYTSRMVDQCYLGNCIVLRKNSYDNGLTWKNHIPEINLNDDDWIERLGSVIKNYKHHGNNCREYYENFWTPKAIVKYLKSVY